MKEQAIIPIFIPHEGCPNDCVFCNQKHITAKDSAPSDTDIRNTVERNLSTMQNLKTKEIAFFGGSFTGLDIREQNRYLSIANEYKTSGKIDGIRLSTRPDYISESILDNLKEYNVDLIELGVQSFDEDVLKKSGRGHGADVIYTGINAIKTHGFDLGIQLMVGLPGDTKEKSVDSAMETVRLTPSVVRLYPTVILENTELSAMYENGSFEPFSDSLMLETVKEMYKVIHDADIRIIRVGLKSTDLVSQKNYSDYHPAFRELVESQILLDQIIMQIDAALAGNTADRSADHMTDRIDNHISLTCHPVNKSRMIGHRSINKEILKEKYPHVSFSFHEDIAVTNSLGSGSVRVFVRRD